MLAPEALMASAGSDDRRRQSNVVRRSRLKVLTDIDERRWTDPGPSRLYIGI